MSQGNDLFSFFSFLFLFLCDCGIESTISSFVSQSTANILNACWRRFSFFFVCGLHKRWWWWCVKYILLSRLFLFFCSVGLCFCAFVTLYHMSNLPPSPLPLLPTCLLFTSSLSVSICLCSFSFLLQVLLFFFFLLGRKKIEGKAPEVKTGQR